MKYNEIIKLIAVHKIDADVITIPKDGWVSIMTDSKANPNAIHSDPMIRYIEIIIMKLPVASIFDG